MKLIGLIGALGHTPRIKVGENLDNPQITNSWRGRVTALVTDSRVITQTNRTGLM